MTRRKVPREPNLCPFATAPLRVRLALAAKLTRAIAHGKVLKTRRGSGVFSGQRVEMVPSALRRRVLLSSTMLVAAVVGYGRRAYGACVFTSGSSYVCSGANVTTQT